jgi:hypothetical protein
MLALLLDFGLDPDERMRLEDLEQPEYSWGMPLWHCAAARRLAMAEMLLDRGADPNGRVYASGSPVFRAHHEGDAAMIDLLRRYGGTTDAITAGMHGLTDLARKMLAGEVDGRKEDGTFAGQTMAEQLLWGAATAATRRSCAWRSNRSTGRAMIRGGIGCCGVRCLGTRPGRTARGISSVCA